MDNLNSIIGAAQTAAAMGIRISMLTEDETIIALAAMLCATADEIMLVAAPDWETAEMPAEWVEINEWANSRKKRKRRKRTTSTNR